MVIAYPLVPTLALLALSFLPRIYNVPILRDTFWAIGAALLLWNLGLAWHVRRTGRTLAYRRNIQKSHWIQAMVHSSIYIYWATAWPEVGRHVPLIAAQILFYYAVDMLLTWSRGQEWFLGFGGFPIVLSTNLFLWFRDDWFFFQFAQIGLGTLCKHFVKWERAGRKVHIFNPSAVALSVSSILLLVTRSWDITWGQEISVSQFDPIYIYEVIFAGGLVVQFFFGVTLMTLSAGATLYALSRMWTASHGMLFFGDTAFPIAVFLGMHLLVTDPATSPRREWGKVLFGAMYGAGIMGLYLLLQHWHMPTYFDKVLPVPLLNLLVPWIDRLVAPAVRARTGKNAARKPAPVTLPPPATVHRLNPVYMILWVAVFSVFVVSGDAQESVKSRDPEMWKASRACDQDHANCDAWVELLDARCATDPSMCQVMGLVLRDGRGVRADQARARFAFSRGCNQGYQVSCDHLAAMGGTAPVTNAGGPAPPRAPIDEGRARDLIEKCNAGDVNACLSLSRGR